MVFTINMVLEILKPFRGTPYIKKDQLRKYQWVSLLPEESDEMSIDLLYVCRLTEALKRKKEIDGFHYLCIRDRYWDPDETDDFLEGLIVINENKDISWLLNLVQARFLQLSKWEADMQHAIIDNCGYQRLLELCEPILHNFVSILDSAYKLLAYTRNEKSDDPINVSLIEKGYHTEETIKKFQTLKRFKLYNEEHGLIISHPGEISRYEVVSKWCRYGGVNLLHVVMVCSNTPLSKENTELFEILFNYIDIIFQREQKQFLTPQKTYSSFLLDILYGSLDNQQLITEQAKRVDVPYTGNFDLYRIVFEDTAIVLIGRFIQELASYLPFSKIISKDYEVTILNIYKSSSILEESEKNLNKILPLLNKYKCICGVSENFTSLFELKVSAMQATKAYSLGIKIFASGNHWHIDKKLYEQISLPYSKNIFRYNDVYIYYMLQLADMSQFNFLRNTAAIKALKTLINYDKENGMNLVGILYCYLVFERRATAAGNVLHMHRNNVLYHIGKITDITGINLDDYWVRLQLLLAYHYLELQEENT